MSSADRSSRLNSPGLLNDRSLPQVAYQDGIELYRPEQIQGENRDIYFLYWRVGQRDPYVPELAEIRDKVVDVWKQREALTIAKAEAPTSGRQGRQSGRVAEEEGLADRTDLTAQETNDFSWLSTGFTPAGMEAPGLSFVDNVQGVGEGFMEAVHRLKVGETGIAVNGPQDRVYLVRILSETPGIDELRKSVPRAGRPTKCSRSHPCRDSNISANGTRASRRRCRSSGNVRRACRVWVTHLASKERFL